MKYLEEIGAKAKDAAAELGTLNEETVNAALGKAAEYLRKNAEFLKKENAIDLENAEKKGLSAAFIDRLTLTDKVIEGIAVGIEQVAKLDNPVGKVLYSYRNEEQDIDVKKIAVPFGVIGIIFESRPNVAADAFALCFKTRNAVILRGGSDAVRSNTAIVKVLKDALKACGINENAVAVIEDTSRETAAEFMKLNGYLDLLIPRGGASLIKTALKEATVPVIETGLGNCHVYVDKCADIVMATNVVYNAKTQRYGVCNACESLVIHSGILKDALPDIAEKLAEKGVEIRCDERSFETIKTVPGVVCAKEEDFYAEYDAAIISVKTVDDLSEAIAHINKCSTHHSDAIITEDLSAAEKFLNGVDSACVYHNASTRFSDGFVFGLGAEIGISTQKLHARGPMGLNALCTTKYVVKGNGSVRK